MLCPRRSSLRRTTLHLGKADFWSVLLYAVIFCQYTQKFRIVAAVLTRNVIIGMGYNIENFTNCYSLVFLVDAHFDLPRIYFLHVRLFEAPRGMLLAAIQ